jgi:hypothetical protein
MMASETRQLRALRRVTAAVLLACGLLRAGDPLEDKALRAAVVADADLLGTGDAAGWRALPIQKTLDAIRADMESSATPGSQARVFQTRIDTFVETLGVTTDDVTAVVVSARVRGLEAQTGTPQQGPPSADLVLQQLGLVVGLRVAKPLSMAKVRLALSNAAAEQGMELVFDKADYKGASVLAVARPEQPGKAPWLPREFSVALLDGDTCTYLGTDAAVKAALDRFAGGVPAPFAPALEAAQKAALPGALSSGFFVPSDTMRSKAREQGTKMQAQNPMAAAAVQSVGGLQHVVFGAKGSDRISFQLGGMFASAQDALQMKTMIDAMVLGMGKMMLMQAVGRPIPLIESVVSKQDGVALAIVGDLTEEDCRALAELSMKGPQAIPGVPGGTAPGAGPVGVPAPQPAAPAQ